MKEGSPELDETRDRVCDSLSKGTLGTLALAKKKLFVNEHLNSIRIILRGWWTL